ncbi:MAG TPA: DNA glycosylase [Candidatus Sulfopaludibacter sp.]|nr:DNA glycosylase [Candidatus Sulfopaludibacter sp.]
MINKYGIDIDLSLNSGQYFLWEKKKKSWYGIYGETILKITEKENERIYEFDSFPEYNNWQKNIFRQDDNYEEIIYEISQNERIKYLVQKYPGLRILRQKPIQCIFSFLCSSNNNIPRIRLMLRNLSKKFGKKIVFDDMEFYTFPDIKSLCNASIQDLLSCGLGYRSRFVLNSAKDIADKIINIEFLKNTKYEFAKEELLKLDGIGEKIADCILLFSFDKLEAFPIDTWIIKFLCQNLQQITKTEINLNSKISPIQYKKISKEIRERYGKYSGYVQQYIYYNIREENGRKW